MKVKDLKRLLHKPENISMEDWNETDVLIPMNGDFDGAFTSPCVKESGEADLGIDENSDETKMSFILVPCGFFEPHEGVPPELN